VLDAALMVWLCCNATRLTLRELMHALVPGVQAGVLTAILILLIAQAPLPARENEFYFLGLASLATVAMVILMLMRQRMKWS
jgi:hypothetical protein